MAQSQLHAAHACRVGALTSPRATRGASVRSMQTVAASRRRSMWPSSGWTCAGMGGAWRRTKMPLGRQARVALWLVGCKCCSGQTTATVNRHRVAEHCPAAADRQAGSSPYPTAGNQALVGACRHWELVLLCGRDEGELRCRTTRWRVFHSSVHVGAAGVLTLCTALLHRDRSRPAWLQHRLPRGRQAGPCGAPVEQQAAGSLYIAAFDRLGLSPACISSPSAALGSRHAGRQDPAVYLQCEQMWR